MKQQSLFGNLPSLSNTTKELNKKIVQKANTPKESKTRSVSVRASSGTTALQKKILAAIEVARRELKLDDSLQNVQDIEAFREYCYKIRHYGKAGLDTETTGLDEMSDHIVGHCFYVPGEKAIYVPTHHTDLYGNEVEGQIPDEILKEEYEKMIAAGIEFDFHNAKFDIRFIRRCLNLSAYPKVGWDTQLASNFLNENEPHNLKPLWSKYVSGEEAGKYSEYFSGIPFNFVPVDIAYLYAAKDPKITVELADFQRQFLDPRSKLCIQKGLDEAGALLIDIETPLIEVIAEIEDTGIGIDDKQADGLHEEYTAKLENVEEELLWYIKDNIPLDGLPMEKRAKLGNPVNIGSTQQLAILIYDALGLDSVDKASPRGTGEELIEKLKARNGRHAKFFDYILEYRGVKKLLSTYIDKLPNVRKESTNKVHGKFNQYGAKTGRFSSSDPNLQNIPSHNKEIRKMFIPTEGYVLIGADYSQQEPRVLAHLTQVLFNDSRMSEAYASGKDLYSWMASAVYNVDYDECKEFRADGSTNPEGKKRRSSVKNIILGLMYGRGTKAIAEQLGVSVEEAQKIVDMLFDTFPAIRQITEYYQTMAREKGFVQTVWGRKRRLPDINLPTYDYVQMKDRTKPIEDRGVVAYFHQKMMNTWKASEKLEIKKMANAQGIWINDNGGKIAEAERQCLNSVIQGTSADITKKAMLLIGKDKRLKKLGFRLLLTVHDEVIGEAPKENALKCARLLEEIMMEAPKDKISVPMSVDAEITERWYGKDISDKLKEAM